jgi:hypothetical protein
MDKYVKISTTNDDKLALFIATLKAVAADMKIKVKTVDIPK